MKEAVEGFLKDKRRTVRRESTIIEYRRTLEQFWTWPITWCGSEPRLSRTKIVGHSSLDIILTYYHVSEDELPCAVDGVDFAAVLGEVNEGKEGEK